MARRVVLRIFLIITLLPIRLAAQAPPPIPDDTLVNELHEVEVIQRGRSAVRPNTSGNLTLNSLTALNLSRSMGEADMVAAIKALDGVTTAGDYGSGLSIDGASPSHAAYMIDGATVIFPYRFGGLFSTFNTPHFQSMQFTRSALPASMGTQLGSHINFVPSDGSGKPLSGVANVGLLSSSITLRTAPSPKVYAAASARVSYIDQLYGRFLNSRRSDLAYKFHDLNLTLGYRPAKGDSIVFSGFLSRDRLGYDDHSYQIATGMSWANALASVSWHHTAGTTPFTVSGQYTHLSSTLDIDIPQMGVHGPSSIGMADLKATFNTRLSSSTAMEYGTQAEYGRDVPQYAVVRYPDAYTGLIRPSNPSTPPISSSQHFIYTRAFGSLTWLINERLTLEGGVSAGFYHSRMSRMIVDPRVTLTWRNEAGEFVAHAGGYSQYLHHIGFSSIGLASNFWICANPIAPIQHAWTFNLNWMRPMGYTGIIAEAGVFCSLVNNQAEYRGDILEVIDAAYDPMTKIILSKGVNTGIRAALRRNFGEFTGSAGYSYGYGHRRGFEGTAGSWRADTDPGHTLQASLTWHLNTHWELGANFRYASGRVYTPVKALYLIAGNIAMEYGERNSARLTDYQRLDLSASYMWSSGRDSRLNHIVNLSLINAYGHRNVEMQYFIFNTSSGHYTLKRLNSLYRFLPSLSYTLIF